MCSAMRSISVLIVRKFNFDDNNNNNRLFIWNNKVAHERTHTDSFNQVLFYALVLIVKPYGYVRL